MSFKWFFIKIYMWIIAFPPFYFKHYYCRIKKIYTSYYLLKRENLVSKPIYEALNSYIIVEKNEKFRCHVRVQSYSANFKWYTSIDEYSFSTI